MSIWASYMNNNIIDDFSGILKKFYNCSFEKLSGFDT